jgi:hypothetical protein
MMKKGESMKFTQLLTLVALLLVTQIAYPYAIMNDKNSVSSAVVYIFKDKDKYKQYLAAHDVPYDVLKYVDKIALAAPAVGAALAGPTGGTSLLVAEALPISAAAARSVINALKSTGALSAGLRKLADIVAVHWDVKPGNKGRDAEWNWADIQKEYGIPPGTNMFVVVTDKKNGVPLLQTTVPSNGRLGFIIEKAENGELEAKVSQSASDEYTPAPPSTGVGSTVENIINRIKNIFQ